MRLLALLPKNGLALPGIRANQMSQIQIGASGPLQDWRFHLQGPSVLFESPAGWVPGKPATGHGPRMVYALPRADFYFWWTFDEGEDAREPVSYSTPAFEPKVATGEALDGFARETEAANAAADAKDAQMATGLYRAGGVDSALGIVGLTPIEPEPEVADPDDSDGLPMPPARKGKRG